MKKSLFRISFCVIPVLLLFCTTNENKNYTKLDNGNTQHHIKSELNKNQENKNTITDTDLVKPIIHPSPNQKTIDSIKQIKEKLKEEYYKKAK